MASPSFPTVYKDLTVKTADGAAVVVHYVEAGNPSSPTFLLLHGFPSSTTQFRNIVPLLSDRYHVLAPDLPGFGLTKPGTDFIYTFDSLASAISAWLKALRVSSYALYIFDYGAPVGLRLALEDPSSIKAIVSQNGNAYEAGFLQAFWAPIFKIWETCNSPESRRAAAEAVFTLETTKFQYVSGVSETDQAEIDPQLTYHSDYLLNLTGTEQQEHQLDLLYDYRTNPQILYPKVHHYFQESQVPLLAIWGKHDPAFGWPGAEAFKTDLPDAEIVAVDASHFALETKGNEIVTRIRSFLARIGYGAA